MERCDVFPGQPIRHRISSRCAPRRHGDPDHPQPAAGTALVAATTAVSAASGSTRSPAGFCADATAFWRLCDANDAVVPDAPGNPDLVGIPIDAPRAG